MKTFVIIDNGHGIDTRGKSSPDGRYREWQRTRAMARALAAELGRRGITSTLLVPEDGDTALPERCRRANELYREHREAILVSLHSNASGSGAQWGTASGWSAWVAPKASVAARRLAALLTGEAAKKGMLGNRATPPCGYWTAKLAICRDTRCPAVVTENMFHDNRADVDLLLSEAGLQTIVRLHADAICAYYDGV